MSERAVEIMGRRIQIDRSGQGHAWRDCTEQDGTAPPPSIAEEIAAEIEGPEGEYVAGNGQHYRWRA